MILIRCQALEKSKLKTVKQYKKPWKHVPGKSGTSAVLDANDQIICGSFICSQTPADQHAHREIVYAVNQIEILREELQLARSLLFNAGNSSKTIPTVLWFASQMEAKLKKNRHKGDQEGWRDCGVSYLMERLHGEFEELTRALSSTDKEDIIAECADVANFAMMIADIINQPEEE